MAYPNAAALVRDQAQFIAAARAEGIRVRAIAEFLANDSSLAIDRIYNAIKRFTAEPGGLTPSDEARLRDLRRKVPLSHAGRPPGDHLRTPPVLQMKSRTQVGVTPREALLD